MSMVPVYYHREVMAMGKVLVSEMAKRLGVAPREVRRRIYSGNLNAEMRHGQWYVEVKTGKPKAPRNLTCAHCGKRISNHCYDINGRLCWDCEGYHCGPGINGVRRAEEMREFLEGLTMSEHYRLDREMDRLISSA